MDTTDYAGREAAIIAAIKAGGQFSPEVATEMVKAKQELQLAVLAATGGGLLGPDTLMGGQTDAAGERYEKALAALEAELGLEVAS